jgi:hypothetical protein
MQLVEKSLASGSHVILATQEAEIRRIAVRSQPWANSLQDPILKKMHHKPKRAGGVAQVVRVLS